MQIVISASSSSYIEPFRIAVIGAGTIARNAHIRAALSLRDVQLTAIVDPVIERAKELAKEIPGARAASAISQIGGMIDGAIVCVPNHVHATVAQECIDLGIPVLVEKPMGRDVADAIAIRDSARRRGVTVAPGYMTRFDPRLQFIRQLIQKQEFGRVERFVVQNGSVAGYSPMSGYNLTVESAGGGVLVVLGSHLLDRILWWFGPPQSFEYNDDSEGGPESHATASLFYDNGSFQFTGCLRVSKAAPLPCGAVLDTQLGTILSRDGADSSIEFHRHSPSRIVTDVRYPSVGKRAPSPYELQLRGFIDSVRGGTPPMVGAEDGILVHQLVSAFYANRGAGRVAFEYEQVLT